MEVLLRSLSMFRFIDLITNPMSSSPITRGGGGTSTSTGTITTTPDTISKNGEPVTITGIMGAAIFSGTVTITMTDKGTCEVMDVITTVTTVEEEGLSVIGKGTA